MTLQGIDRSISGCFLDVSSRDFPLGTQPLGWSCRWMLMLSDAQRQVSIVLAFGEALDRRSTGLHGPGFGSKGVRFLNRIWSSEKWLKHQPAIIH